MELPLLFEWNISVSYVNIHMTRFYAFIYIYRYTFLSHHILTYFVYIFKIQKKSTIHHWKHKKNLSSFWSPRFFWGFVKNHSLRIGSPASGVCSKYLRPRIFRVGFPWFFPQWKTTRKGWRRGTLQGTNISHLGKRKFIFKCAGWDGFFVIPRRVNPGLANYRYVHVASWVCQSVYFKNDHTLRQVNMDTPKTWWFSTFLGLVCSKPFGFKKCFERITKGVYMYVVFCVSFSVATEEHVFRSDFP